MGLFKNLKNKKWFQALTKLAPTVATALGGPFAGMAANVIAEATGMNPDELEEAVISGSNPEVFAALKAAEQQFLGRMEELDIKRDELVYEDIQDARRRQVETKDWTPAVLTGIALTFFFALSYSVLTNLEIVSANQAFVMFLFGSASTWVTQGMSFFLGSSKGSKEKTAILANGHAPK